MSTDEENSALADPALENWTAEWEMKIFVQYARLKPHYLDITDAGGNEYFLIDGDSLLAHFICNPHENKLFRCDASKSILPKQFSPLQIFWLIERFILELKHRCCNFDIVFFCCNARVWREQNNDRVKLLRTLTVRHLAKYFGTNSSLDRSNSGNGVFVFSNWLCNDWLAFLERWKPRFVMLTDGSSESVEIVPSKYAPSAETAAWIKQTLIWRAFISVLLSNAVPVVLIEQLKFRGNHITAHMFHSGRGFSDDAFLQRLESLLRETTEIKIEIEHINLDNFTLDDPIFKSESTQLILLSLRALLNESADEMTVEFARLVCIVRCITFFLPLSCRNQPNATFSCLKLEQLLNSFYHWASIIAENHSFIENDKSCDICDFFDEHLFVAIVTKLRNLDNNPLRKTDWSSFAQTLWRYINESSHLPNSDVFSFNSTLTILEDPSSLPPKIDVTGDSCIHRLKNKLFIDILKPILPSNCSVAEFDDEPIPMSYEERNHWHNLRELESKTAGNTQRDKQKFMAFQQRYAESLLDTLGLYFKPIVVEERGCKEPQREPGAKARSIIANNTLKKTEEKHKNGQQQFKQSREDLEQLDLDYEKLQYEITNRLNNKTSDLAQDPASAICLRLFDLEHLAKLLCTTKEQKMICTIKVDVYEKVKFIYESFPIWRTNKSLWEALLKLLQCVGFKDISTLLRDEFELSSLPATTSKAENNNGKKPKKGRAKSGSKVAQAFDENNFENHLAQTFEFNFRQPRFTASEFCSLIGNDHEFQMRNCGHLFNRNTGSSYDSRVNFEPDDWQRKLLDIVDRNESALISAPTSSGKTFISFYAMEKIVKSSDSDVVVYVSPTKALVNQTAAEAYARFGKKQFGEIAGEKGGKAEMVVGVFTRDYRHYPMECQILICVPEILEILFLSPAYCANGWVRRVKRVIFDEVHMIGEMDRGQVWEHLLVLVPCPVLALSATISNCSAVFTWFQSVQEAKGIKAHLVTTERRYCELKKYVYMPINDTNRGQAQKSIHPNTPSNTLVHINLLETMTVPMIAQQGFATDAKLLPEECLDIYAKLTENASTQLAQELNLHQLNPSEFFESKAFIVKDDSDSYEKLLKEKLVLCAKREPETLRKVIDELSNEMKNRGIFCGERHELQKQFPWLIAELSATKNLPAIVFCLDRSKCMRLAISLCDMLQQLEKEKRESDPKYQQKKEAAIKAEELTKQKAKQNRDIKDTNTKEPPADDEDQPPIFDWRQQHSECTLVSERFRVSPQELYTKYKIKRVEESLPPGYRLWLMAALDRGIGVHHAGLPQKYLTLVEMLFRRKHLSVVIATGTLAMGIHAPCRSVVFAGNSAFLSSLSHRQMMGRAGRRGCDLIGNIIYFGIPKTKIFQLLSSSLPPVLGHMPSSTSLVLRALCFDTDNKLAETGNLVRNQIKSLFCSSFFSMGREMPMHQILHQVRFSVEYLMGERFIRSDGTPCGFAGLLQHMFYTEPSNLVFCALLQSDGLIEEILGTERTDIESLAEDFVAIFASLFNKVPLHRVESNYYDRTNSSSKIVLPQMSEKLMRFIKDHNRKILGIFCKCMKDYVQNVLATQQQDQSIDDSTLPLSRLRFPLFSADGDNKLVNLLKSAAVNVEIRSRFSALSGHDDEFDSAHDLACHARAGIFLDESSIPTMASCNNLNAYILDFYKHGQIRTIETDNGIREGRSYDLLKDSLQLLKCIDTSLEEIYQHTFSGGKYKRLRSITALAAKTMQAKLKESVGNAIYG